MGHNIMKDDRFAAFRNPGWHFLGTVIEKIVSMQEALKIGKIDFTYADSPIGYTAPDGTFHTYQDRKVILRSPVDDEPSWVPLGVVGANYQFLQNEELARGLDLISSQTGWHFETVGALGNGETVFLTLDMGEDSILGDKYRNYLVVSDGKAASRALQIVVCKTRVVCQNTLMASDGTADIKIRVQHGPEIEDEYGFWLSFIKDLKAGRDRMTEDLIAMASVKVGESAIRYIIDAAYPEPKKNQKARQAEKVEEMDTLSIATKGDLLDKLAKGVRNYELAVDLVDRRRAAALDLFHRFNTGQEEGAKHRPGLDRVTLLKLSDTPYAAVQAVTELVDWGGVNSNQDNATAALFGENVKIKQRAYAAALEVVAAS